MFPDVCVLITSFFVLKLIISIAYSLTKHFYAVFASVYIMIISMLLNDAIVEIEKIDGICSNTFVVKEYTRLFSYPIFSIKHPRSA